MTTYVFVTAGKGVTVAVNDTIGVIDGWRSMLSTYALTITEQPAVVMTIEIDSTNNNNLVFNNNASSDQSNLD